MTFEDLTVALRSGLGQHVRVQARGSGLFQVHVPVADADRDWDGDAVSVYVRARDRDFEVTDAGAIRMRLSFTNDAVSGEDSLLVRLAAERGFLLLDGRIFAVTDERGLAAACASMANLQRALMTKLQVDEAPTQAASAGCGKVTR